MGAVEDPLHGGAEGGEEGPREHLAVVHHMHVEDGSGADLEEPLGGVEGAGRQQFVRLALGYGEDDRVGLDALAGNLDAPATVLHGRDGGDA